MESKATATRFFPRSFYLFWLSFSPGSSVIHSQNQDLITKLSAPIPPYWSMLFLLHYKFDYVWKLPRPLLHQIMVHRQRTLTTWKPFILTKNLSVLGTASMWISKAHSNFLGPGIAPMCISMTTSSVKRGPWGCGWLQRVIFQQRVWVSRVKFLGCTLWLYFNKGHRCPGDCTLAY